MVSISPSFQPFFTLLMSFDLCHSTYLQVWDDGQQRWSACGSTLREVKTPCCSILREAVYMCVCVCMMLKPYVPRSERLKASRQLALLLTVKTSSPLLLSTNKINDGVCDQEPFVSDHVLSHANLCFDLYWWWLFRFLPNFVQIRYLPCEIAHRFIEFILKEICVFDAWNEENGWTRWVACVADGLFRFPPILVQIHSLPSKILKNSNQTDPLHSVWISEYQLVQFKVFNFSVQVFYS